MAELKLPFTFPPNMEKVPSDQIQADLDEIRQFVQDLNDAVQTFTNLTVTGTLTGQTAVVGGTMSGTSVSSSGALSGVNLTATGTLTNTNKLLTDSSGNVTQPNQPSFLAYKSTTSSAVSDFDVDFSTEIYDQGADYDTSSYTFTAPVTGKYVLAYGVSTELSGASITVKIKLITSNNTFVQILRSSDITPMSFCAAIDMDAGDTAKVRAVPSDTVSIYGNDGSELQSFFTGSLIN